MKKKLKAIDLYSGIGGWHIGLKLNEIEVIKSMEWWEPALKTLNANMGKNEVLTDIRAFDFNNLPKKIDIVVGSPPCTQFSFSNRGGSGNIDDGIIDLYKFFECVSIVKPKFWAMENVPRVKSVLLNEIKKGGQLENFKEIIEAGFVEIIDFSEFGLPQKRKRCIASNANLELLNSYKDKLQRKTLKQVLSNLSKKTIKDVNYKISLPQKDVTDLEQESLLNCNEKRMNKDMKTNHPVYNNMSFPEKMDSPARTITATCTRVSRESLVVPRENGFSRLNVRERGVIQGFPINYQFMGKSNSQKVKMIGNAIPPVFTYALASSFLNKTAKQFIPIDKKKFISCTNDSYKTEPDKAGRLFSSKRSFRYAIPKLRFKSGTSFELSNKNIHFKFKFFYGNSKNIQELLLDNKSFNYFSRYLLKSDKGALYKFGKILTKISSEKLQNVWVEEEKGLAPFDLIDQVDRYVELIESNIKKINSEKLVEGLNNFYKINSNKKIKDNIHSIITGIIICSFANQNL